MPNHLTRAKLEMGLQAHRSGNLAQAVDAYQEALALAPDDADARHLLGVALLELGRPTEAVEHLQRAAEKYRSNGQVIANLAQGFLAVGRHPEAESAFRKAVRLEPARMEFQVGVAAALGSQGKFAEAEQLLRRLSTRFPDAALVFMNLGHALRDQGKKEEALVCYQRAGGLDPSSADAHNDAGRMYHESLRLAEAEDAYRRCLSIDAGHGSALLNLASLVIDRGRPAEAEDICRRMIAAGTDTHAPLTLLAAALGHQGRLIDALEAHRRAAQLLPDDKSALENYAVALLDTGRVLEGMRVLSALARRGVDSISAQQVLGSTLLAHGQLQDGWRESRNRPAALRLREKFAELAVTFSVLDAPRAEHVCVLREQGLGDELFFLRYAAVLRGHTARLTYRTDTKLTQILSRLDWIDEVIDASTDLPRADSYVLVADLPEALAAMPASALHVLPAGTLQLPSYAATIRVYWPPIPESIKLEPIAERVSAIRSALERLGAAPYIGVTWRAGTKPEEQGHDWVLNKAIDLSSLAAALRGADATFIALQRNPAPGEIAQLASDLGRPVHDLTALNGDLEGMLALLAVLDDYVGVSNTNMHLRAAVGKPARVLVPSPAEWRWMHSGRTSPWFPEFSVYRQSLNGDWTRALERLKHDLSQRNPKAS